MRTTLTIDDDVAFGLKRIQESETDKTFKEIVNDTLRRGLGTKTPRSKKAVKLKTYPLGLRKDLNFDNIEELLDRVEGPRRR